MEFIHYSSNKEIPLGSVIFSEQHKGSTFKRFYAIYKKVADELGKYYPESFGYAYPEKREHFGNRYRCYVVTADECKVTKGNFNFSIYAMMARGLGSFKGISSLEERKLSIDTWIEASARTYFAADGKDIEYISDCFEVIQ